MAYEDLTGFQKILYKVQKPFRESKVVQEVANAPVVKQIRQFVGAATTPGTYYAKKQAKEIEAAKIEAQDIKGTYDYLIGQQYVKDQLFKDALKYNPKIQDVITAGKNVASLSNSLVSQQISSIEANMQQERNKLSDNQRKAFKDFYDYKAQNLISYVKGGENGKKVLIDPNVTKYIAYRNKISEAGTKLNFREKAGGMAQGFISPYAMTINGLDAIAGAISGNEKRKEGAKSDLANYFGRSDRMEDPSQVSVGDMAGEYFGRQMGWMDLFPMYGAVKGGVKTMRMAGKYGKAGEGLLKTAASTFDTIGTNSFKTVLKQDGVLMKIAKEQGLDISKAGRDDLMKFVTNNPGAKSTIVERLSKLNPDLKQTIGEFDEALTKHTTYFKYPRNVTKDIISSFYMMTPQSMKIMGRLFAAGVGVEAVGAATQSDTLRAAGGLFTNPISTAAHLMQVNKGMFITKAYQEYADGYGYTVEQLEALPENDPLKMEIMKTADIMYNNTTVTQMLGWQPKSVLGKVIAGLGDSALAFGGFALNLKAGQTVMDKAKLGLSTSIHAVDKAGNLNIKPFAAIEELVNKQKTFNQQQLVFEKETAKRLAEIQNGKQINPLQGMQIARLAQESYDRYSDMMQTASTTYGVRVTGMMVEKYKNALDTLLGNESFGMRVKAANDMKQAHQDMMTMIENSDKLQGAEQFKKELQQEQNRFMMSAQTLLTLRDAQGVMNAITKQAIKMSGKAYTDFGPAILNNELALNLATLKDGRYTASMINKVFKVAKREQSLIKGLFKEKTNEPGRWVNQEIEHAINLQLEQSLSTLKGSPEYETLFDTIRSAVHTTIYEGLFFKYSIDKVDSINTITNNILRSIFIDKSITTKSSLGKALEKVGKIGLDDKIMQDLVDGASKFSDEYHVKAKQNLDTITRERLDNTKSMFQAIQGISSVQRGLKTTMDVRSFLDVIDAPEQLKTLALSSSPKEFVDKLYENADLSNPETARTVETLRQYLDVTSREMEESQTIKNMDTDTFITMVDKTKDVMDDVLRQQGEAIIKLDNEQKTATSMVNAINKIATANGDQMDNIPDPGRVSPEMSPVIKSLRKLNADLKSHIQKAQLNVYAGDRILSEAGPEGIKSVEDLDLESQMPSTYLFERLYDTISRDEALEKGNKKTRIGLTDVYEAAQPANTKDGFLRGVLDQAGLTKKNIETLVKNPPPKYKKLMRDLGQKFYHLKNAEDVNAKTTYFKPVYDDAGKIKSYELDPTKSEKPRYEQISDGIENLGSLGKKAKYLVSGLKIDTTQKSFAKRLADWKQRLATLYGEDNIYVLKNDTAADFVVLPKADVLKDINKELGDQGRTDNDLTKYAQLKSLGVFKRRKDIPKDKRGQVQMNASKYSKKRFSGNIKDKTKLSALILDDKAQIDGAVYMVSPIARGLASKAGYSTTDSKPSAFKANYNGEGWGLKGMMFMDNSNMAKVRELLHISNNKERAIQFLADNGIQAKTENQIVDGLITLRNQGKLDIVANTSAVKDYFKGIEGYPGKLMTDEIAVQVPGLRIYQDISVKPDTDMISASHQYFQSIWGKYGDILHDTLYKHLEGRDDLPYKITREIMSRLNAGDIKGAQDLLQDNLHKLGLSETDKLLGVTDKSGNFFTNNAKEIQGMFARLLHDNGASLTLNGYRPVAHGLTDKMDGIIRKDFNIPDHNYTVISKKFFGPDRKSGDHLLMGRDPSLGPMSTPAVKVIFIEDIPEKYRNYFMLDEGKATNEMYIPGKLAEKLKADYDADRLFFFTDFSKEKPSEGKRDNIGDMMYEYTTKVDESPGTFAATKAEKKAKKSNYERFKETYKDPELDMSEDALAPAFNILNAKDNTARSSARARGASILNWKIFENLRGIDDAGFKKDIADLHNFSEAIQESVQGTLLQDNSLKHYDTFIQKNFKGLNTTEQKELRGLLRNDGYFAFLQDKKTDGTSASLKDYLGNLKKTRGAAVRIVELVAKNNAGNNPKKYTAEKSRLLGIISKDPRVWGVNNFKDLQLKEFEPTSTTHFLNKFENMMNNYKIFNASLMFDTLKDKHAVDLEAGMKAAMPYYWKDSRGSTSNAMKRRELQSEPSKEFLAAIKADPNLALFALSTENSQVMNAVERYHPELFNDWATLRQSQTRREGRTNLMADMFNRETAAMPQELKSVRSIFANKDLPAYKKTAGYRQIIEKLVRGDTKGAQEIQKKYGLTKKNLIDIFGAEEQTILSKTTEDTVSDVMRPEIRDTAEQAQEIATRKAIHNFVEEQIVKEQENMYAKRSSYKAQNTMLHDLFMLYKNTPDDILAKRNTPLTSYINKLPNGQDLIQSGRVPQYFRDLLNSIYKVIPADMLNKRLALEHVKETKNYDTDLMKTFRKNIKDLQFDAMKDLRQVHAAAMHDNVLEAIKTTQSLVMEDPLFKAMLIEEMNKAVKPGVDFQAARAEAVQKVMDATTKNFRSRLTPETQAKIKDAMKGSLSQLGGITNKIITDVSTQMRELSNFTENPESLPQYIKTKMDNLLIEKGLKQGTASDALGEFMATMNTVYKSTTLSYAPGRIFTEGANALFQTWVPFLGGRLGQKGRRILSLEEFKQKLGRDEKVKVPDLDKPWSELMKMFPDYEKVSSKIFQGWKAWPESRKEGTLAKFRFRLGKGGKAVSGLETRIDGKRIPFGFESASEIMKEKFFKHEFYTQLHDMIVFRSESDPGYADRVKQLFSSEKLSADQKYQKQKLMKEVERLATKNVKENFFDYANNPIRVAGLETYVPFANFFYNSVKMFAKQPLAWMGLMNTASNMMQDFTYPEFDIDEESIRGYFNIQKFGLGILGALGFANAGVDLKRFLPIDISNPQFFGYSYQKMFFPTNDPDFTRLMDDKDFHRYDYGLKKLSPVVGDLVSYFTTNDKKNALRRLMYLTTGLSWKDQEKYEMLKSYYKQEYDDMINKSSYSRNQFNVRREKNGMPKMTKEDVLAKKYFDELVFNGDSAGYKYLNVMADYVTMSEFLKIKDGDYITDTDAADVVTKSVRSLLMDLSTSEMRGKATSDDPNAGMKLFEKAKQLDDMVIDANGNVVKRKTGDTTPSVLARMRSLGTMDEFLDRLEFYAGNYPIISEYSNANMNRWTDAGTADDAAKVAAFKFYFQEEEKDPKRAKLEKENPELYFKSKTQAILNGSLRHPINNQVLDEVGSERTLTDMYKEYLSYSKGLILTDMEKAKSNVNSYTLLKNIYRKYANQATDAGSRTYRKNMAIKASEQVRNEWAAYERYSPTFRKLSNLKTTISKMGPASTYAEEMSNYKKAIQERTKTYFGNYYSGKKTWYNKFLNDKNAVLRYSQTNGQTIDDTLNQLDFDLYSLGLSTQNDGEGQYVSF